MSEYLRRKREAKSNVKRGIKYGLGIAVSVIVGLVVLSMLKNYWYMSTQYPVGYTEASRFDNPNSYNSVVVYGSDQEAQNVAWRNEFARASAKLFAETGIQMYYVSLVVPEEESGNFTSRDDSIVYLKDYLKQYVDDEYGIYLMRLEIEAYNRDASVFDEWYLGEEASVFFTPDVWRVFLQSWTRCRADYGIFSDPYTEAVDLFVAHALHATQTRVMSALKLVFEIFIAICAIILIVFSFKRGSKRRDDAAVLEASLDDLHEAAVEEMDSRDAFGRKRDY